MKKVLCSLMALVLALSISITAFAATGWNFDGNGWWYQRANGTYPVNSWLEDGGDWYHFDNSGYMQTGWIFDGAWYYLTGSGAMATGWVYDGGSWYYMNSAGAMVTGTQTIDGRVNHFSDSGEWLYEEEGYSGGSGYPSLESVGIYRSETLDAKVDQAMDNMIATLKASYNKDFFAMSDYDKASWIRFYVGFTYYHADGAYSAEGMLDNGYGTCWAFADLVYCMARKAGLLDTWLTESGRMVDHAVGYGWIFYGSDHMSAITRINGQYYDLDADNLPMMYSLGINTSPEKISESYAYYILGYTDSYTSIH